MTNILSGPQALTIFTVNSETSIPSSAKTASYTAPQGYYCNDSGKLYIYIKGRIWEFIEKDRVGTKTESVRLENTSEAETNNEEYEEIYEEIDDLKDCLEKVKSELKCLSPKVESLYNIVYKPLEKSFCNMEDVEDHD